MATQLADQKILMDKQNKYTCVGCRIKFDSIEFQRAHFKTEWHLYNLKRKVCKLEPIDLDNFTQIQDAARLLDNQSKNIAKTKQGHQLKIEKRIVSGNQNSSEEQDDEANWEEIDEDELLDEDYNEEEAAEMLAKVVRNDTCLFCNKKSSNTKVNVNHMNLAHGFFIPEEKYLIDLDGLMEYLGFKVGAGATCVWCNKQFTSLHGVRLHMLYKDHCRIFFDQEKAIEEFKDFYDYSDQEHIPMKPLNELAIPKKRSERYAEHQRALSEQKSYGSRQLVQRNPVLKLETCQVKSIKKFNAQRAKTLLRIGMSNNNAMRGRLRQQNPI